MGWTGAMGTILALTRLWTTILGEVSERAEWGLEGLRTSFEYGLLVKQEPLDADGP